jgi:hypoxanthine phosphoribosyltransferase
LLQDIQEVLFSTEELQVKVNELGALISKDYAATKEILMVGILRGAVIFMADLARNIDMPVALDFMAVSSYGSSASTSGEVRILKDLDERVEGRHVLVVEDIIDSGLTLSYLIEIIKSRNPASVKLCTLLSKPGRRKVEVPVDYIGFNIPDAFVVGYGLDYAGKYRNLPFVGVLRPEVYK